MRFRPGPASDPLPESHGRGDAGRQLVPVLDGAEGRELSTHGRYGTVKPPQHRPNHVRLPWVALVRAAQPAPKRIPIVFWWGDPDLVESGRVASRARPGGTSRVGVRPPLFDMGPAGGYQAAFSVDGRGGC